MSSKAGKNSAHDQAANGGDVLGGPDPGGGEDILSAPGREPHPDTDILGGPDGAGPEDELTAPGHAPATPAPHDILGGPDSERHEDILSTHPED
jgi:hypothetical protein